MWETLKVINCDGNACPKSGDSFYRKGWFPLCNTAVLKALLGTIKYLVEYLLSLYYCCGCLFCIY